MTKVKSITIYVLSVLLAFETGLMVAGVSTLVALDKEKEERRDSRVSYRPYNYYRRGH